MHSHHFFSFRYVPQEGSFRRPRKRPAHRVRNNRSPMQAPARARGIGWIRPYDIAPVRAQQKNVALPTLLGNVDFRLCEIGKRMLHSGWQFMIQRMRLLLQLQKYQLFITTFFKCL